MASSIDEAICLGIIDGVADRDIDAIISTPGRDDVESSLGLGSVVAIVRVSSKSRSHMFTSSAYSTVLTSRVTAVLISSVNVDRYSANNRGPEMDPCGTPSAKCTILLKDLPTHTQYLRSVRKLLNHLIR